MARTNLDEIERALLDLMSCCELDQPGPDGAGTLADSIFSVDVRGIRRRSIDGQHGPAGEPWPPNEPRYAARKGGLPIGVLTGDMLSEAELSGERVVSAERASMTYGVSAFAQQKAIWFEEGTSRQPERPFFAESTEDDPAKEAIVNEQIARTIQRLGG